MSHDPGGPNKKDAEIIRLLRSGTEDDIVLATELTVKEYECRIKRFVRAMFPGLQYQDREDIAQWTIAALLRKVAKGTFTDEGGFDSLLYKIAACFAISLLRKITLRKVDGTIDVAEVARVRYDEPHKLRDLQHALREATREELTSWQRRVFEAYRDFVAADGREPTWKDVAQVVIGRTVTAQEIDAIKRTYYRAIAKLESHLKKLKLWP